VTNAGRTRALYLVVAAAVLLAACGPAPGPEPIVWDKQACAHCRMLISEPAFAAQLRMPDGSTESFDDPGCLIAQLGARHPQAIWFHHVREERWIPGDAVAFERVPGTPMGYDLGAVDAGSEGALDLEAARARVAEREASR
jgi:copper chaperone NosL